MPGSYFSADDVIGHSLYANRDIPVYKNPFDNEQPYRTVPAGGYVGTVVTYLEPSSYRKDFYWVLGNYIGGDYVRHHEGDFSIDALQAEGVQTIEDQIKQQQDEQLKQNSPFEYYLKKYGIWVVVAIVGAGAVSGIIKKHL